MYVADLHSSLVTRLLSGTLQHSLWLIYICFSKLGLGLSSLVSLDSTSYQNTTVTMLDLSGSLKLAGTTGLMVHSAALTVIMERGSWLGLAPYLPFSLAPTCQYFSTNPDSLFHYSSTHFSVNPSTQGLHETKGLISSTLLLLQTIYYYILKM